MIRLLRTKAETTLRRENARLHARVMILEARLEDATAQLNARIAGVPSPAVDMLRETITGEEVGREIIAGLRNVRDGLASGEIVTNQWGRTACCERRGVGA